MPLPDVTIWSFNLSELKFSSFSHKSLFDPRYHLRKTRISEWLLPFIPSCCPSPWPLLLRTAQRPSFGVEFRGNARAAR